MREVLRPDSLSQDYGAGPTTTVTAAPNAHDAVVEGLKSKLRAADVRERELHQHLLFHMKEKDLLVDQVAELQRVCEALLLSQMQEATGPAASAATAAATAALSAVDVVGNNNNNNNNSTDSSSALNSMPASSSPAEHTAHIAPPRQNDGETRSSRPPAPPQQQQQKQAISSSLKAIMGTVSAPAAPRPQDPPSSAPTTTGTLTPGALSTALGGPGRTTNASLGTVGNGGFEQNGSQPPPPPPPPPPAVQVRPAGADPTIDIPQLLLERGGRIRITSLWEAYQSRFGETPYSLKDLFSMVKAGAIPFVVHEPPAGIRLLEEAPVYQQLRHQLQLQRQLGQQRAAAAAAAAASQAASGPSYQTASPMMGAAVGRGTVGVGGVDANRQQQQQQQQHHQQQRQPASLVPSTLVPPPPPHGPQMSHRIATAAATTPATAAAAAAGDSSISFGSGADRTRSASPRFGTASRDDHDDGSSAGAANSGTSTHEEDGSRESQFRFGSYGGGTSSVASDGDVAAAVSDAGASGVAGKSPEPTRKRGVDWKELQRNLNLLLKEEGALNGRDLNHLFQLKFGKSPFLDGTPLRYAVSAGWLRGVCFDLAKNTFNLCVRVPLDQREDAPEGAPAYPPGGQPHTSAVPRSSSTLPRRNGPPVAPSPVELDWKKLSREFRQLLSMGSLEAKEIHAKYHREFGKPLHIGAGYSMRQAVLDGRLEGITFEHGSRRLTLA